MRLERLKNVSRVKKALLDSSGRIREPVGMCINIYIYITDYDS